MRDAEIKIEIERISLGELGDLAVQALVLFSP
jgi:hypothetical protein